MIRMTCVIKLLLKLFILEVNVGDPRFILNMLKFFIVTGTKLAHSDGELLELHDVLREGACLVAKDVIDHSDFLVETWWLYFARKVTICIIHLDILSHKVSLNEVDHFKRHEKRNRNEVHQSYKPDANVEKALSDHVCIIVSFEGR